MSNLIQRYLTDMGEVRRTGAHVAETSFYPALDVRKMAAAIVMFGASVLLFYGLATGQGGG